MDMGARRKSNDYFSMGDAAKLGQLIKVRCGGCRRTVFFLASDLAELFGEDTWALKPPISCSRCQHDTWLRIDTFTPRPGDYGQMVVRRPGPVKVIQTWRTEKLGELLDISIRPGADSEDSF